MEEDYISILIDMFIKDYKSNMATKNFEIKFDLTLRNKNNYFILTDEKAFLYCIFTK